jgi:hypothetical protein
LAFTCRITCSNVKADMWWHSLTITWPYSAKKSFTSPTEVFHSAVRRAARKRVGVELFGEQLLAGDHPNLGTLDASESQPVGQTIVSRGEDPFVHASFDRIAGTAVGAAVKSITGGPNVNSNQSPRGTSADLVLVVASRCRDAMHRQIDIHR